MIWTFHVLSLKTEKTRRSPRGFTKFRKTEALVLKSTEAQPNLTPYSDRRLDLLLKQSLTLFARGKQRLRPTTDDIISPAIAGRKEFLLARRRPVAAAHFAYAA